MKKLVLVIEDNEQNLYLVTFILEKYGYEVIQARNGAVGIEIAKQRSPDLILLDIQLPGMNGYEVAEKLKQIDEIRNIPVIAVTSYAMAGDREKAFDSGCTGYLTKPINPNNFMDSIQQYLSRHDNGEEGEK